MDVFSLIFSKLSLPQFLRSAAVCVSWSAAVRDLSTRGRCFKFRGQSPWLVLNHNPRDDPSAVTFYAFDERRMYTIPVPDPPIIDRLFLGSAHGRIITIDVRLQVQLLNPITGLQIDLPRLFSSEGINPIRDTAGRLLGFAIPKSVNEEEQVRRGISSIRGNWILYQCHLKATLSADPSLGDGYTVALIQYPICSFLHRDVVVDSNDIIVDDVLVPDILDVAGVIFDDGSVGETQESLPSIILPPVESTAILLSDDGSGTRVRPPFLLLPIEDDEADGDDFRRIFSSDDHRASSEWLLLWVLHPSRILVRIPAGHGEEGGDSPTGSELWFFSDITPFPAPSYSSSTSHPLLSEFCPTRWKRQWLTSGDSSSVLS
ncbi:hypothetical protein ZIOFF_008821 [Zingiber officinale]|uniref:KIB1-4 beta-propeller domain-containing protein n=1 Tax=Zingiber officinale TaxID=94328 RepID=A0A8J5M739_ZINOF|nr:hypothetical protein ZIOFF_008821 [Zingiber officinale]